LGRKWTLREKYPTKKYSRFEILVKTSEKLDRIVGQSYKIIKQPIILKPIF